MTDRKRKVCVISGSRAEYGLLRNVMQEVEKRPSLALQLIVTGMHLAPQYGMTVKEIKADGYVPDAIVDMLLASDTLSAVAKSVGVGVMGFADALERLAPDILVVLGDRFEILAAVQVAMLLRIPVAHLHGGELTEGAVDDAIRHAVTKMSHLHFVAADAYRRRLIQLGESPEQVFNVGALGVESVRRLKLPLRSELASELGLDAVAPYFVLTYHPETQVDGSPAEAVAEVLAALDEFPEHQVVMTGVNADAGGREVDRMLRDYLAKRQAKVSLWDSLGQRRYLGIVRDADAVVGNSSSGLIEVPALRVPTVNIGNRQGGRLRGPTVIDVGGERDEIVAGLYRALSPEFRDTCRRAAIPLDGGDTAARIVDVLETVELGALLRKTFHDVPVWPGEGK